MASEEVDIDLTDPEVGAAANKIGAAFKAKKARQENKKEVVAEPVVQEVKDTTAEQVEKITEDVIDIDLEDPEVDDAAKKIQAAFKARKKTT